MINTAFAIFVVLLVTGDAAPRPSEGHDPPNLHLVVTLGASGDLAKRSIYPSLWSLFKKDLLPKPTIFVGYARSNLTINDLRNGSKPYMTIEPGEEEKFESFWKLNKYIAGSYNSAKDLESLNQQLKDFGGGRNDNRLFYLALPPSVYEDVTIQIKKFCMANKGWTRIVLEKPFGKDSASSESLANHLASLFSEDQIYRIDHYLGEEMVQNILTLRFANRIFESIWNRENVASVLIMLREPFGTQGRGGYFDEYGIIRDVMQNHLLQTLSLVAMEKPMSSHPDDIRNEKVKLLRDIKGLDLEDVVLGQYVGDPTSADPDARLGYLDDPQVPKNSTTATYAFATLRIDNKRWQDVPFNTECGKALNEYRSEVRIQFRNVSEYVYDGKVKRNELVIRLRPGEALSLNIMIKTPGFGPGVEETELDVTYGDRYKNVTLPIPHEILIMDVIHGSQKNFVRNDELSEAWRIFTPLLHEIESSNVVPFSYEYGSRGPKEGKLKAIENDFIY